MRSASPQLPKSIAKIFEYCKDDYGIDVKGAQLDDIHLTSLFIDQKLAQIIYENKLRQGGYAISDVVDLKDVTMEEVTHFADAVDHANSLAMQVVEMMNTEEPNEPMDWLPDLHSANVCPDGTIAMTLVHMGDGRTKEVIISSKRLCKTIAYLKQLGKKVAEAFKFEHGGWAGREEVSEAAHVSGMEALNAMVLIQKLIQRRPSNDPDQPMEIEQQSMLSKSMEIFAWINAVQGVSQSSVEIVQAGLNVLESEGSILSKAAVTLASASKIAGAFAMLSGGVAVAFDTWVLIEAISTDNSAVIPSAIASIVFDSAGLSLSIAGVICTGTISAVAGSLAVPLAGLSIAISCLITDYSAAGDRGLWIAAFLCQLGKAYEKGGHQVKDGVFLLFLDDQPPLAAIKKIDLPNRRVHFVNPWQEPDRTGHMADWRELYGVQPTVELKAASLSVIVLPVVGNSNMDYSYERTFTMLMRGDWVLERMDRIFREQGRRFVFRCGKVAEMCISSLSQEYRNTDVETVLEKTSCHLFVPEQSIKSFRFNEYGMLQKGDYMMNYKLQGAGGTYALTVNSANSASVTILEQETSQSAAEQKPSTWVIHADKVSEERASSPQEFARAAVLMLTDWKTRFVNETAALNFVEYFEKTWLHSPLSGWYEGFSAYSSTNNGLESKNGELKKCSAAEDSLWLSLYNLQI
uniref:TcdA/TcdB toxin pore forming domain-containing protein n=1 Tax=Ditylenchus dipsaci TaxID=166011 RepID=A0A915E0S2_9BILA